VTRMRTISRIPLVSILSCLRISDMATGPHSAGAVRA
jgi:hypothetical protein